MIVGIDNDKLEFLATDDGQLVVTVRNLTEAMVDREGFLDAYVTHCKDCKDFTGKWCILNSRKEFDPEDRLVNGDGFCAWAERKDPNGFNDETVKSLADAENGNVSEKFRSIDDLFESLEEENASRKTYDKK